MNGMIGKIISISKPDNTSNKDKLNKDKLNKDKLNKDKLNKDKTLIKTQILFEGEDIPRHLSLDFLDNMSLAYLITIHKSQGSEYDYVVILLDNAIMNTINLLYTAITRTKKKCILIADDYTIDSIIKTKKFTKRISNLQDFCKSPV